MDPKSWENNSEKEELEIFKIVGTQIHVLPKIKTKKNSITERNEQIQNNTERFGPLPQ